MRKRIGLAIGVLAFLAAGCSDTLTVLDSTEANRTIAGSWQFTSGNNFTFADVIALNYVKFDEDGSGTITYQDTTGTKALWCMDFFYSVVSDNALVFTFPYLGEYSLLFGSVQEYAVMDDNLTLGSDSGLTSRFSRVDAVPAAFECRHFSGSEAIGGLTPEPDDDSGFAYDGTRLWYLSNAANEIVPFDPTAGTIGTAVAWASSRPIHAFQGGDLWTVAANSWVASRRTTGDVENLSIDTSAAPFSYETSINAMAWDGTNLWLYGDVDANDRYEFVKADVAAGTKLDAKPFDVSLESVTWDGSFFWALASAPVSPILKIDPATFEVVATYYVPVSVNPVLVDWTAIAAAGGNLYLLGQDESTSPDGAIIVRMTP